MTRPPERRSRGESTWEQRESILIQQSTTAENSKGEPTTTWTTYRTIRAYVAPTGATEWWGNQQVMTTEYFEIVTRYDSRITQTMRGIWRGKTLNITGLKATVDRGRLWWLHILAYEAL